jgi:hypothetical protein
MSEKDTSRARRLTWLWLVAIVIVAVVIGVFGRRHPDTVDTPGTHTPAGAPGPVAESPPAPAPAARS